MEGDIKKFSRFRNVLNEIGVNFGITFKGDVGEKVDSLDVTIRLTADGHFNTTLFVKPTDATRYLHRRSDHGQHSFNSIPYSQFRRAAVLCSDAEDRKKCIGYMCVKLYASGYKQMEIDNARQKVLELDRDQILDTNEPVQPLVDKNQLIFIINRNQFMSKAIKHLLLENQSSIDTLLGGPTRLIVAERRNANIASLLFAKSSFSKTKVQPGDNQKCNGQRCMLCPIVNLRKCVTLWKNHPYQVDVKLDFRCNCTTESVIYLYICKLCTDNRCFYVGQSVNSVRDRANGHRQRFNERDFDKSALSHHIFRDHPASLRRKLKNFYLGIIKEASPSDLDRLEDYYVNLTKANLSLNRYKVTK